MSEQIKRVQVLAIPPEFAPALQPMERVNKTPPNVVEAALDALAQNQNRVIKLEDVFPEIVFGDRNGPCRSPQIYQPEVCGSPKIGGTEDWSDVDNLFDKIFEAVGPDLGGDEILDDEGEEEITASQSDLKPQGVTWPSVDLNLGSEGPLKPSEEVFYSPVIPALEKLVKPEPVVANIEIPQMVFPLTKKVPPIWLVLYKDDANNITLHDIVLEDIDLNVSEEDISNEVLDHFKQIYAEKHEKYRADKEVTKIAHTLGVFYRMRLKTKRFGKTSPEWDIETSYLMFRNDPVEFKELNFKDLPF